MDNLKDSIYGLIYGQCLGDAVGLPMEFKLKCEGFNLKFPYKESIRGFPVGDWTEDSDHMILLLETLIESPHDFALNSTTPDDICNFAKKLFNWKNSGFSELGDTQGLWTNGITNIVINKPDYVSNPIICAQEAWRESGCKTASNGAIMRSSILALLHIKQYLKYPSDFNPEFFRSIKNFCKTTHYDIRCIVSCFVLCLINQRIIIAKITKDNSKLLTLKQDVFRIIRVVCGNVPDADLPKTTTPNGKYDFMLEAFEYFNMNLDQLHLDEITKVSYTYKCMGCALWISDIISTYEHKKTQSSEPLPQLNYKKIITKLINECGDADTNAAVAGSVLGTYLGYKELPQDWLEVLPNKSWLNNKIEMLINKLKYNEEST